MVQALQRIDNARLQDSAVHVLWAAVSKDEAEVCSLIVATPGFADGLSYLLPGGPKPLQSAKDLMTALAKNSNTEDAVQLTTHMMTGLVDQLSLRGSAVVKQHSDVSEQAAWVLAHLAYALVAAGKQQLADTIVPLLCAAGSNAERVSSFRCAVASRLGVMLGEKFSSPPTVLAGAASALAILVQSASPAERMKMASSAHVVRGLTHHMERCTVHRGKENSSTSASSIELGADAAGAVALLLAADCMLRPAAAAGIAADSSMQACSENSIQSWLAANSSCLQQMTACGWGSVTVEQLAGIAKLAGQAATQQQQAGRDHVGRQPVQQQPKEQLQQQPALTAAGQPPGPVTMPPPPSPAVIARPPQPAASMLPAARPVEQQQNKPMASTMTLPAQLGATKCCNTAKPAPATAAGLIGSIPAGDRLAAANLSKASGARDTACRRQDQATAVNPKNYESTPSDATLAARQVAAQPFDSQQLERLSTTYLRCAFVGQSRQPAVRRQELVPLLQQLHTQAKEEQRTLPRKAAAAAYACAANFTGVQPTPAAVKLLRALRLLQHWDIVCPTQPGMPEPLRKMMQQAGCAAAAAGSACGDDDEDDVQVVDTEPAAEVDDDVQTQLQQLEIGDCDMVLVKYVPGRHEQPDVQLLQVVDKPQQPTVKVSPTALMKHEDRSAGCCRDT
jgi:hypothetical protein